MKITKFGHCCLLLVEQGLRILTDPGCFTLEVETIKDIDVILITHAHQDHIDVDTIKVVVKNNPVAKIYTIPVAGEILAKESIPFELLENGQSTKEGSVSIEAHGKKHAIMHKSIPAAPNTGYYIAETFFFPGDSFYNPNKKIDILALPIAGPWMKLSEAIDYALEIKPRVCLPVHDSGDEGGSRYRIAKQVLNENNIEFIEIELNKETEF